MDNIFPKKDEKSNDDLTILYRLTHYKISDAVLSFLNLKSKPNNIW
jgi:hypothetical protein